MLSRILDLKFHVASIVSIIFFAGIFYQRTEANSTLLQTAFKTFVRQDVQAEKDARITEKLDMLLQQMKELKEEIRQLRNN